MDLRVSRRASLLHLLRWRDLEPWEDFARCREHDPEIFFPDKGDSPKEAKRICAKCPVRIQCLNYALRYGVRYGVWGGLSDRERRRLLRIAS